MITPPKKVSPQEVAKMVDMRSDGATTAKIAETFGITTQRADKLIKEALLSVWKPNVDRMIEESFKRQKFILDLAESLAVRHSFVVNPAGGLVFDVLRDPETDMPVLVDGNTVRVPVRDTIPQLKAIELVMKADESRRKMFGLDKDKGNAGGGGPINLTISVDDERL